MTRRTLILLAAGGSAALLLGALGFQHLGGLAPCKLCYWQRYPHAMAAGIGLLALLLPAVLLRPLAGLGALAAGATAGIGLYHSGVEQGWWEGPTTCTSAPIGGLSAQDLMAQIMAAPMVRCDDIPWSFLSLSMASWNALASAALMGLWLIAARRGQ